MHISKQVSALFLNSNTVDIHILYMNFLFLWTFLFIYCIVIVFWKSYNVYLLYIFVLICNNDLIDWSQSQPKMQFCRKIIKIENVKKIVFVACELHLATKPFLNLFVVIVVSTKKIQFFCFLWHCKIFVVGQMMFFLVFITFE